MNTLLLFFFLTTAGARRKHRIRQQRPDREEPPALAASSAFERRTKELALRTDMLEARAREVASSFRFGVTKSTTRSSSRVASPHWRCCPSDWFSSREGERQGEVYLVRPLKSGGSTLQAVLWAWARRRSIPVVSNHLNDSGLTQPSALVDTHLSFPDLERVAKQRRHVRTVLAAEQERREDPAAFLLRGSSPSSSSSWSSSMPVAAVPAHSTTTSSS